jgi:soluble lytic murein transglycosylase
MQKYHLIKNAELRRKTFFILLFLPAIVGFVVPRKVNLQEIPAAEQWSSLAPKEMQKKFKMAKDPLTKAGISAALTDWSECVHYASLSRGKTSIKDWVAYIELNCATQLVLSDSKQKKGAPNAGLMLKEAIERAQKIANEAHHTRATKKIEQSLIPSRINLCEWYDDHAQWKELRNQLKILFDQESDLSRAEKSKVYFYSGDLLVAERTWADAFWQFQRAKDFGANPEIESRLKAILPMVPAAVRPALEGAFLAPKTNEQSQPTSQPASEEQEITGHVESSLVRNDTLGAVDALTDLLKKYPMGLKAKYGQDKLYELLLQEIDKSKGPNGETVAKKRIESVMLDFDSERQGEWGKSLFDLQYYSVAAPILKKAAAQLGSSPRAFKDLWLAGRAYQLSQNFNEAKKTYKALVKSYPAAPEVTDVALQWALISYNENDASEAITHLEVVRSRKMTNQQDLTSLFWLFQSYKMKKAQEELLRSANELVRRFPLTYYGLLAFEELNHKLPTYDKTIGSTVKVYFSESESRALVRARTLMQLGLLNEASEELSELTLRNLSPDESQYLATFFARSLKYQKAFTLLGSSMDDSADRRNDFTVRELFPKEYWDIVRDEERNSGLDPLLLLSVMKQESAFDAQVVSHSGAVGLLQMIPPTAEDMKRELGLKIEVPKDLSDPVTNVKVCAYYLSKLIKSFNGSIPLALAAYNAGPRRITNFINNRGALTDTWVDELPWSEPSFYVKSILKNYIVYRMLYGGLKNLPVPPWTNSQKSSVQ